jgi:hypothetical protein
MFTPGLRTVLCSIALSLGGCAVYTPPAPPPQVATVAPAAAPQPGYCREFTQTVIIGGMQQQAYGISCQQADGSWKISNDRVASSRIPAAPPPAAVAAPAPAPAAENSYLMIPYQYATGDDTTKPQK